MNRIKLLVIPGEGIGPEITIATLRVLKGGQRIYDLPIEIEIAAVGLKVWEQYNTRIPDLIIQKAQAADGLILGPLSHNDYPPTAKGGSLSTEAFGNLVTKKIVSST